jgi:hypothetical protein
MAHITASGAPVRRRLLAPCFEADETSPAVLNFRLSRPKPKRRDSPSKPCWLGRSSLIDVECITNSGVVCGRGNTALAAKRNRRCFTNCVYN